MWTSGKLSRNGAIHLGVIAERSDADGHVEPKSGHTQERGEWVDEPEGAHAEQDEAGNAHAEKEEAVLGVNVESTPLVVLAVIVGVALAVLAATRLGERAGVLAAIALIALAWAALDVREVLHQADESRTGVALVATVAILHIASAAAAGRLAAQARRANLGSPERPGTMPA